MKTVAGFYILIAQICASASNSRERWKIRLHFRAGA